jgi:hypothetical protein
MILPQYPDELRVKVVSKNISLGENYEDGYIGWD